MDRWMRELLTKGKRGDVSKKRLIQDMWDEQNQWQDWIIMRIIGGGHPSNWEWVILHADQGNLYRWW